MAFERTKYLLEVVGEELSHMSGWQRVTRILSSVSLFAAMVAVSMSIVQVVLPRPDPDALSDRINSLSVALSESVELIGEIEQEIAVRQERVANLERRASAAQSLAELSEPEIQAVEFVLASQLRESDTRAFWQNVFLTTGVGFVFYLAGLVTPLIWRRAFSSNAQENEGAQ